MIIRRTNESLLPSLCYKAKRTVGFTPMAYNGFALCDSALAFRQSALFTEVPKGLPIAKREAVYEKPRGIFVNGSGIKEVIKKDLKNESSYNHKSLIEAQLLKYAGTLFLLFLLIPCYLSVRVFNFLCGGFFSVSSNLISL